MAGPNQNGVKVGLLHFEHKKCLIKSVTCFPLLHNTAITSNFLACVAITLTRPPHPSRTLTSEANNILTNQLKKGVGHRGLLQHDTYNTIGSGMVRFNFGQIQYHQPARTTFCDELFC